VLQDLSVFVFVSQCESGSVCQILYCLVFAFLFLSERGLQRVFVSASLKPREFAYRYWFQYDLQCLLWSM